jgi:hypothetical protein
MNPMPPPRASTERRDRHVFHEMGQIVRALEARGPQSRDGLETLVGGSWWEEGRFDRALAFALEDGLVHRTGQGELAVH